MFLYDVANLLPILIVILVSFRFGYIPMWLSFFLGVLAFTPFFLNYVLFWCVKPAPDATSEYPNLSNLSQLSAQFYTLWT